MALIAMPWGMEDVPDEHVPPPVQTPAERLGLELPPRQSLFDPARGALAENNMSVVGAGGMGGAVDAAPPVQGSLVGSLDDLRAPNAEHKLDRTVPRLGVDPMDPKNFQLLGGATPPAAAPSIPLGSPGAFDVATSPGDTSTTDPGNGSVAFQSPTREEALRTMREIMAGKGGGPVTPAHMGVTGVTTEKPTIQGPDNALLGGFMQNAEAANIDTSAVTAQTDRVAADATAKIAKQKGLNALEMRNAIGDNLERIQTARAEAVKLQAEFVNDTRDTRTQFDRVFGGSGAMKALGIATAIFSGVLSARSGYDVLGGWMRELAGEHEHAMGRKGEAVKGQWELLAKLRQSGLDEVEAMLKAQEIGLDAVGAEEKNLYAAIKAQQAPGQAALPGGPGGQPPALPAGGPPGAAAQAGGLAGGVAGALAAGGGGALGALGAAVGQKLGSIVGASHEELVAAKSAAEADAKAATQAPLGPGETVLTRNAQIRLHESEAARYETAIGLRNQQYLHGAEKATVTARMQGGGGGVSAAQRLQAAIAGANATSDDANRGMVAVGAGKGSGGAGGRGAWNPATGTAVAVDRLAFAKQKDVEREIDKYQGEVERRKLPTLEPLVKNAASVLAGASAHTVWLAAHNPAALREFAPDKWQEIESAVSALRNPARHEEFGAVLPQQELESFKQEMREGSAHSMQMAIGRLQRGFANTRAEAEVHLGDEAKRVLAQRQQRSTPSAEASGSTTPTSAPGAAASGGWRARATPVK